MALEVPRYDEPLVRRTPIPGPVRNQPAPLEAFGGGQAAAGAFHAAGDLADLGGKINQQEFNAEAEASIRDYMGKLSAEEARLKAKMQTLKGTEALGATDQMLKEFDASKEKMLSGIANPVVKQKVDGHAAGFRSSLENSTELYAAGEKENADKKNTASLIASERNNAITGYVDPNSPTKPKRVMDAIARQRAAIGDQLHGQTQTTIETAQAIEESKTHSDVLERMLAGGNDLLAKEYYKANEAGFFGDDKTAAEKKLQAQSTLGAASRLVASAFDERTERVNTGGNNWTINQIPGVKTIEEFRAGLPKDLDDKTREVALDLARARFRDQHIADEQRQDSVFKDAWNTIAAGGMIPLAQMTSLDPERQRALNVYAKQVAKGGERDKSDPLVFAAFYAMTDRQLRDLTLEKLDSKIRPYFTTEAYEAAAKHWGAAHKDPEAFKSLLSDQEITFSAFKSSGFGGIKKSDTLKGIEKDDDKADAFMQFKIAVDGARAKHLKDSGKNPDDDELKKIAGRVALRMAQTVSFDQYSFITGDKLEEGALLGGLMKDERIIDLKPNEIEKRFITMPWEFRQKMYNYAAGTPGGMAKGTPFKIWEDANRGRINRAFIAARLDASDEEIYQILLGKK